MDATNQAIANEPSSIAEDGWRAAVLDLTESVAAWRIWGVLAFQDVRQRYRRSFLGEFWLSISLAITVIAIGIVYGGIFRVDMAGDYVPYLAAGFAVWTMLSGNISEGSQAFIFSDAYLRNMALPKSIFVMRVLLRNTIVFGHNLIVVIIALMLFQVWPGQAALLLIPNTLIVLANCFWIALVVAIVSTRFRDLPPIITNMLQLVFLMTPIIWRPDHLPERMSIIVDLNLFASLIALLRDPLVFNQVPSTHAYVLALSCTVIGSGLAFFLLARTRRYIVFWL